MAGRQAGLVFEDGGSGDADAVKSASLSLQFQSITRLPAEILSMQHIRRLDVSRNAFTTLEDFVCLPSLEVLDLFLNKVRVAHATMLFSRNE